MKTCLILFITISLFPLSLTGQDKGELLRKAQAHYLSKEYKKSLDSYETANKLFPDDEEVLLGLGMVWAELNDFQKAYDYFTAAIRVNNKSYYSYYYRGEILLASKMPEEAINDLNMAIKYNKSDTLIVHCYNARASARSRVRDFEGVISDSRVVLAIDSLDQMALSNLGMALNSVGKNEEALAYLKLLGSLDSTSFFVFQNIGFILAGMERYEEALTYFDKAVKADPKQAFPYSNRGHVKMKLKDYPGAMADINKSIKLDPTNSYAFRNRALVYLETDKKDLACKDLIQARTLGFDSLYGDEVNMLIITNCQK